MSVSPETRQRPADQEVGGTGNSVLGFLFQIYGSFVYCVSFLIIGITGIVYSIFSMVLCFLLPRRFRHWLGGRLLRWIFRIFFGALRITGVVRVDSKDLKQLNRPGGILIAANHPCLIDAVMVISRIPDIVCVIKSGILRNPVYGGGARLAGFIANDSPTSMVKNSVKALKEGKKLLIFPEGTRTVEPPVNQFRRSFAVIARAADAPVSLVFVESNSPCLGKGWPLLKMPVFPLRYRLTVGEELQVPQEGDVKDWVSEVEEVFREELEGKVAVLEPSED